MVAAVAAQDFAAIWRTKKFVKFVWFPSPLFPITWKRSAKLITKREKKLPRWESTQFEVTAGLNDSPTFISALADLVTSKLDIDVRSGCGEMLVAAD